MKSSTKIILAVSMLILVLFTALREMGIIDFNFHTTKSTNTYNGKWESNTATYNSEYSFDQKGEAPTGVIVQYDSKIIGDLDAKNPITIDISDSDLGIVWLPFYKYSNYTVAANIKNEYSIKKDSTICDYTINATINAAGKFKMVGFCTYNIAKNLILDKIMKAIYEDISKKIDLKEPTIISDDTLLVLD